MMLLPLVVSAQTMIGGLSYELDTESLTASVAVNKCSGNLEIPEYVVWEERTFRVTSICESAFAYNRSLNSVIIPSSVKVIGSCAFRSCANLKSVTISNGVTTIENQAFSLCNSLSSITIPESVTSIEFGVFWFSPKLTSIKVADGNKVYDSRDKCNAIIETATNTLLLACNGSTIPLSVTTIGELSFFGCSDVKSLNIPAGVTSIGEGAFNGCSGLKSIIVDAGNKKYDSRNNCNALIETSTNKLIKGCSKSVIPQGIVSIAESAFTDSYGIESIAIPASVTSIGKEAFYGCGGTLSSISVDAENTVYDSRGNCNAIIETSTNKLIIGCNKTVIPQSVKYIEDRAFYGCEKLTTINIPSSVSSIGSGVFDGCHSLREIYCFAKEVPNAENAFQDYAEMCDGVLHVPASALDQYKAATPWKYIKNIVAVAEEIAPTEESSETIISDIVDETTNLSNAIIDNAYYNLNASNGDCYDSEEKALVINSTMTEEQMNQVQYTDVGDASLCKKFSGIIFQIPAGKGVVTVDAKTLGTHILMVQIGNNEATKVVKSERGMVDIPYDVSEATYVYLYASTDAGAAARFTRAPSSANSVLLYAYKVTKGAAGVVELKNSRIERIQYYDLQGRLVLNPQKGVYIQNGKKSFVK